MNWATFGIGVAVGGAGMLVLVLAILKALRGRHHA